MSQPLSILHVLSSFDPEGSDGWSRRAARLIAASDGSARHTIAAETVRSVLSRDIPYELAQNPPSLSGAVSVARYESIAWALRRYDLVLSYGAGAIDVVMARRAFANGTPPVVHHEDPTTTTTTGAARLYRRIALGAAAGLVVGDEASAGEAAARWKVPAARVHAIPDGIDLSAFARGPDAKTIADFRRNAREVVIGVVADMTAAEDLPLLVRAVAGLAARFRLVIVGEGAARADVERAALAMGIDDRVVFPGAIAEGVRFLGGFDLLLLPMRLGAAPPVVVEAMAAGVPVVGLRGSAAAGLVAPENSAHFSSYAAEVPLRDTLQALVTDAALRAAIGAANRARALATHDSKTMIARSAALYAAVVGRPGALG